MEWPVIPPTPSPPPPPLSGPQKMAENDSGVQIQVKMFSLCATWLLTPCLPPQNEVSPGSFYTLNAHNDTQADSLRGV